MVGHGTSVGPEVSVTAGVRLGVGVLVRPTISPGVGVLGSSATPIGPDVSLGHGVGDHGGVSCAGPASGGAGQGVGVTARMGRAAIGGCSGRTRVSCPACTAMLLSSAVTFTTPSTTSTRVAPSGSMAIANSVPRTVVTAVGVSNRKWEPVSRRRATRL